MTLTHLFDVETLPVGPWRNGGGDTREIACEGSAGPDGGSADFGWRASIATIAADGPFSPFPGVDRTITLLAGEGVHLIADGAGTAGAAALDHRLDHPAVPFAFSGDHALRARLLGDGGPVLVLNIMTRRGRWTADVRRVDAPVPLPAGHAGVLYLLSGRGTNTGPGPALRPGRGRWWTSGAADHAAPLEPGSVALWADIRPV
ncbi:HutD family protein [Embleya scabrispora]|uniref:HutD family protein n=1 Tax=Embleya scabrispora TaxID=159449 RepID=A0A1T3NR62_9ACTN|nr:HutD family protein [Embleya scabrispora]OPC79182.1 HutD family protein [Embleya scabrispora]